MVSGRATNRPLKYHSAILERRELQHRTVLLVNDVYAAPRTNTLALVGFVSAFVVPVVGLVLGIVALNQMNHPANDEHGKGFARWALILGTLGTLATVVFFVIWFALMGAAVGNISNLRY